MPTLITWLLALMCAALSSASWALNYDLQPRQIAENTWVVIGTTEDFSRQNGGDIVNSAFIVTSEGVIVLDSGPSRRYGEALKQKITEITDQPILKVINSHHHPDHFFGNQAFLPAPILSLEATQRLIAERGETYAENMYRLVGDWMRGTEVVVPTQTIQPGVEEIGGHRFEWFAFSGHSGERADLVLLDHTTGVLFPFDLVFYQRAATTPDTPGLEIWLQDLERLAQMEFRQMLPGHGEVVSDLTALEQTSAYLAWLHETLQRSAAQGLSSSEVMRLPIPQAFSELAQVRQEFERSVTHLYRHYEQAVFTQ